MCVHSVPWAVLTLPVFILQAGTAERVQTPGGAAPSALSAAEVAAAERVQQAYQAHFGESPLVRVSATGRVALPLPQRLTPAELAEEWAREGLDTQQRRERATVGFGGKGAYSHFWGSDAPESDLWGNPDFVVGLLGLAASWRETCTTRILPSDPQRCLLQLGDLSWYEDRRPDPLGHKDHRGDCVDVRLFRTDHSRYEAYYNQPDDRPAGKVGARGGYDRALTQAFVEHAIAYGAVDLFFNDPGVVGVKPLPGHDDHLHLCLSVEQP